MATAAEWEEYFVTTPESQSVAPGPIPSTGTAAQWERFLVEPRQERERARSQLGTPRSRVADPRFNPSVGMGEYLWNEAKKFPGSLAGIGPDIAEWVSEKVRSAGTRLGDPQLPVPLARGTSTTRDIQRMFGADPDMRAPDAVTHALGTVQTNVLGSLPFVPQATKARGAMGAVTELASGLVGGTGEAVVHAATKESSPWLELAGNMAGTILGYRGGSMIETGVALGKATFGALANREQRIKTMLKAAGMIEGSPEYQKAFQFTMDNAKKEVSQDLAKAYAQEDMVAVQAVLDNYERIKTTFPGFKASVGEITGNEPALALQARLQSRNIPELEEAGARNRANVAAIETGRRTLVPPVAGTGEAAVRGVQTKLDQELTALGEKETLRTGQFTDVTTSMRGDVGPTYEAGGRIKTASREDYVASKRTADQLFTSFRDSLTPDDVGNAENLLARLRELEKTHTFDKTPAVGEAVPGVVRRIEPPRAQGIGKEDIGVAPPYTPEPASFQIQITELDNLASAANRDYNREASRPNPDRALMAQLQAIKVEAQNAIREGLERTGNTTALSRYTAANTYFASEHAPKYLTGVNLEVRLRDALNEQRIKPEDVVKAYFNPNGTTEARHFNRQFANNGAAKESLARGVFDRYRIEVLEGGGALDPAEYAKKHDAFMLKYEAPLKEYPWIAKRLNKNNVVGEIANRVEQVRTQREAIADTTLAKVTGEQDVDAFVNKVIGDKKFMFEAMSKLEPEGRKSLGVAVLNRAWDEKKKGSQAVNEFFQNEESATEFFKMAFGVEQGAQHMKNLKILASALETWERAPRNFPRQAISPDDMKEKFGTSWVQIMSALRAMGRRPGSGDWFAFVLGGQYARSKIDAHKNAILKENLFDPALLSATIEQAKGGGGDVTAGMGGMALERGKLIAGKFWDLTKASLGAGAPTAAVKRFPVSAASVYEPPPDEEPTEPRSGLEQVRPQ